MKRVGKALILLLLLAGMFFAFRQLGEKPEEYITYLGESLLLQEGVARNPFSAEDFSEEEGRVCYTGNTVRAMTVIDVSIWQGEIDWQAVAADGVEGVMIRVGYRGYGSETGVLCEDERFRENLRGAQEAGLAVGAYFFSQAVTEEEAREEAAFAVSLLEEETLTLPLAFDWERVSPADARTAHVTGEQLTAFAHAFCTEVEEAGFLPMVYFNQDTAYRMYDLAAVDAYPFWLAEYDAVPSFAYAFTLWQYSDAGTVAGIGPSVDLNLWLGLSS